MFSYQVFNRASNSVMFLNVLVCILCFTKGDQNFPLHEFLITTTSINISLDSHFMEGAQLFYLCESPTTDKCCSCGADCFQTRSCCIDKLWDRTGPPILLTEYMKMFRKENLLHTQTDCQPIQPYASNPRFGIMFKKSGYNDGYQMVSRCTRKESLLASKCTNEDKALTDLERLPVISTGDDYTIFKNKYCALCNDVSSFRNLNITINCENEVRTIGEETSSNNKTILDEINKFHDCIVSINPSMHAPNNKLKKCSLTKQLVQNCSNSASLCGIYQGVFGKYKNIHCQQCNSKTFDPNDFNICERGFDRFILWSTTISFLSDSTTSVEVRPGMQQPIKRQTRCTGGMVYNLFTDSCDRFTCAAGYHFIDNSCVREDQNLDYDCLVAVPSFIYLVLRNSDIQSNDSLPSQITEFIDVLTNNNITSKGYSILLQYVDNKSLNNFILKIQCVALSKEKTDSLFEYTLDTFDGSSKVWTNVSEVYISTTNVNEITPQYGFDPSRYFSSNRLCASVEEVKHNNESLPTNSTNSICQHISRVKENGTRKERLNFNFRLNKTNQETSLSSCSVFHLDSSCPVIELQNTTSITFSEINIANFIFNRKNFSFSPSQYRPTVKGGILVCAFAMDQNDKTHLPYQYKWRDDLEKVEYYIVVTLEGISILFGVLILIFHVLIKELCNRGGVLVLCLSATVLLTDCLFFLCAVDEYKKIVAVLLHFSLLTVNVWSVVLAVDLCLAFISSGGNKSTMAKNISRTTFWRKTLRTVFLTVLIPLIIVGICFALDETQTIRFGYGGAAAGGSTICWMTQYYPRLAVYTIPCIVTYTITAICLTMLLRYLNKQSCELKDMLKSSQHGGVNIVKIALKLVLLLGVVEVIGFVQVPKAALSEREAKMNAAFAFCYNVIKSLRNTIIFFVVVFNKRTQVLWKKRMARGDITQSGGINNFQTRSTPMTTPSIQKNEAITRQ